MAKALRQLRGPSTHHTGGGKNQGGLVELSDQGQKARLVNKGQRSNGSCLNRNHLPESRRE